MDIKSEKEWQMFSDGHVSKYMKQPFTKNTEKEVEFLLRELESSPDGTILDIGCHVALEDALDSNFVKWLVSLAMPIGIRRTSEITTPICTGKMYAMGNQ